MFPVPVLKKTLELAKFFVSQTRIQDLIRQFYPGLHISCDSGNDERGRCIDYNQITPRASITVRKDVGQNPGIASRTSTSKLVKNRNSKSKFIRRQAKA